MALSIRVLTILGLIFTFTSTNSFSQDFPFCGGIDADHCVFHEENAPCYDFMERTIDGVCNDLFFNRNEGKSGTPLSRLGPARFMDGYSVIDGPNPRMISNKIFALNETSKPSEDGLSAFLFTFLQFIDHDIDITLTGEESAAILIPSYDPSFDPQGTENQTISFTRSDYIAGTGSAINNPRQYINAITTWVDGSNVYGSDDERADWLRSGQSGKLKVSNSMNGDLLPVNTLNGQPSSSIDESAPEMDGSIDRCNNHVKVFVAGDSRANEQIGLTAMHTLFVREHNRICDELIAQGHYHDESNYQLARKMVGGIIQNILYTEALPALGINLDPYTSYDPYIDPSISIEFTTAAFRLGHTMVTTEFPLIDEECHPMILNAGCGPGSSGLFDGNLGCANACTDYTIESPLAVREAFFNPSIIGNNGLEPILRGLKAKTQEEIDAKIVDDLRNFLFGQPGQGGMDLASINIQRGRDHGILDYNSLREAMGLPRLNSFAQITSDIDLRNAIVQCYPNLNIIDAWVGLLCEDHLPGAQVGETLHAVLKDQFQRLRDGDRFYFENDPVLSLNAKSEIRNTSLTDVINRNTRIDDMSNAFQSETCSNGNYCDFSGQNTNFEWMEMVQVNGYLNTTGNNNGYHDMTSEIMDIYEGQDMYLHLKPGFVSVDYPEQYDVWIDFNGDGDFTDDDEHVHSIIRVGAVHALIDIPLVGPLETKMRVSISYDNTGEVTPCGTFQYGEVEDYTLNILYNPLINRKKDDWDTTEGEGLVIDQYKVFPNPSTDLINVSYRSKKNMEITFRVFSMVGVEILNQKEMVRAGNNLAQIKLMDLPPGTYYLHIDRGNLGSNKTLPFQVIQP